MARRRINTKFLAICGTVVVVAVVGVIAARALVKDNPERMAELGDRYRKEGNWQQAHAYYARVLNADPKNAPVLVKQGEVIHELAKENSDWADKERECYMKARAVDPKYVPALEHLLEQAVEVVEYFSNFNAVKAEHFTHLRDIAQALHEAKPDNPKAEAYVHVATVAEWMSGITGASTDQTKVDEALARLVELSKVDPTNPDIPYYAAATYVHRAQGEQRQIQDKRDKKDPMRVKSEANLEKAIDLFKAATAAEPDNAMMHYRFFQVLARANEMYPSDEERFDPESRYVPKMREELKLAREKATPALRELVDIYAASAAFETRQRRADEAIKILEQLVKLVPEDQRARLALARQLSQDPARRAEAIKLLREPLAPGATGNAFGGAATRQSLQSDTDLQLAYSLLEDYAAATDESKKGPLLTEAKALYDKLADKLPGSHQALPRLKGMIELYEGGRENAIKAIKDFERCQMLVQQNGGGASRDLSLWYSLALAYLRSQQTGPAETYLLKVLEVADHLPSRIQLAQLYLNKRDPTSAYPHLLRLREQAPKDPNVIKLQIQYLQQADIKNDAAKAKEIERFFLDMPEATPADKRAKSSVALVLGYEDMAVKFLEQARGENPADSATVRQLVALYLTQAQREAAKDPALAGKALPDSPLKDKALAVVRDALAKDPANLEFQLALGQLQGKSGEELSKMVLSHVEQEPDAFRRELRLFEFYSGHGKGEDAAKHLAEAEKLKPDDKEVLNFRFQLAMNQRKWEEAGQYAARLGEKNADEAHGLIYRFRLAMAQGDFTKATDVAGQMTTELGDFARSWLSSGQAKQGAGRFDAAINDYQLALDKQNENIEAYRGIIECYYALNKPDLAFKYIQAGLAIQPTNAYLKEQEIAYQLTSGDPRSVLETLAKAVEAAPTALDRWMRLGGAYFRVAQVEFGRGHIEQFQYAVKNARDTYNGAISHFPKEETPYRALVELAIFERSLENGVEAIRRIAELPQYKGRYEPKLMLADFLLRFDKKAEAEAAMKEALDLSGRAPEVQVQVSGYFLQHNNVEEAAKCLDPNSTDRRVQMQRVQTMLAARKYPEAEAVLKAQLASASDDQAKGQIAALLGFVALNTDQTAPALEQFNQALALDPKNLTALYYRGMLRLKLGAPDPDKALTDLLKARDLNPRGVEIRLAIAEALRQKGQWDEALKEAETTLRVAPNSKEARLAALKFYSESKPPRWGEAERLLKDAQAMEPKDPDWPRVEAAMWTIRGQADQGRGQGQDWANAEEKIKQAMALAPNNPLLLKEYLDILSKYRRPEKYREVVSVCDQLIQTNAQARDNAPWVYEMRGAAKRYLGRADEALADFNEAFRIVEAMKVNRGDALAALVERMAEVFGAEEVLTRIDNRVQTENRWRVIGASLQLRKKEPDFVKAVALIDQVMSEEAKLTPNELATTLAVGGTILMQAGQSERAQVYYKRLLELAPDDLAARNNLAYLLAENVSPPRPEEALEHARKAYDIMQRRGQPDASVLDTYGWMMVLNNRIDEGIQFLQQSIDKKPLVETHYHLGEAYLRKQYLNEAIDQFELGRNLAKEFKTATPPKPVDDALLTKIDKADARAHALLPKRQGGGEESGK